MLVFATASDAFASVVQLSGEQGRLVAYSDATRTAVSQVFVPSPPLQCVAAECSHFVHLLRPAPHEAGPALAELFLCSLRALAVHTVA